MNDLDRTLKIDSISVMQRWPLTDATSKAMEQFNNANQLTADSTESILGFNCDP